MKTRRILILALAAILGAIAPLRAQAPADKLEAERLEQSGTVITIIFDDSGSMAGAKISQAKAAFRQWIAKVPANHRLGLVALNAGPLVPPGRDNRAALLEAVDRLRPSSGTPLVPTIRKARADIERRRGEVGPYERHILLVFTDGEDTTSEGVKGVQRELLAAAKEGVETVGIGYHGEGAYMRTAATRYYEAGNPAQLEQSLAKVDSEIGDTADIVIDERTRATMQTIAAATPEPRPVESSAAPSAPAPAPKPKRKKSFPWVVVAIVVWITLRAVMKRGK